VAGVHDVPCPQPDMRPVPPPEELPLPLELPLPPEPLPLADPLELPELLEGLPELLVFPELLGLLLELPELTAPPEPELPLDTLPLPLPGEMPLPEELPGLPDPVPPPFPWPKPPVVSGGAELQLAKLTANGSATSHANVSTLSIITTPPRPLETRVARQCGDGTSPTM